MDQVLDTVASRVYGAGIKRGKDVRVVWAAGKLYIARSTTDVLVIETREPVRGGGMWKAILPDGSDAVNFMVPGCGSCKRRLQQSAVGQMARSDILAFGEVPADV